MSPWSFDLTGKVAVITGGSRGLGLSIARALAEHGADVVIASRKLEACEAAAAAITEATGRVATGVAFHAGRWEEAERLEEFVFGTLGRCDVLVNNAGMSPVYPSLVEVTEVLFDKVVAVNFKGPFRLSALFGDRMAKAGGGSIINISSIAAEQPMPTELVYAGAKAALDAMTIGLARAYAPTVRCNAILPGPFKTAATEGWDPEWFAEQARTAIPLRRAGLPDEVAGAALYFASDESSYTTGSLLRVDGGTSYPSG